MQNLVFTQLSIPEVTQLFRNELQKFFQLAQHSLPPQAAINGEHLISESEAAEYLNIPEKELRRMADRNDILHYRFGKKILFLKSELPQQKAA